MTSREFVENELIRKKKSPRDIKDILEIFEKAINIENGYSPEDRLIIDRKKYLIFIDGVLQPKLPRRIFNLIDIFNQNKGVLMTRDQILDEVWGDVFVDERIINVHIVKIRSLFGKKSIETVKGIGYKFNGLQ